VESCKNSVGCCNISCSVFIGSDFFCLVECLDFEGGGTAFVRSCMYDTRNNVNVLLDPDMKDTSNNRRKVYVTCSRTESTLNQGKMSYYNCPGNPPGYTSGYVHTDNAKGNSNSISPEAQYQRGNPSISIPMRLLTLPSSSVKSSSSEPSKYSTSSTLSRNH